MSGVDSSGKAASRSASGQGKPRRRRPPGGTKFTGAQLSPYRAPVPGMSKRASRRRAQRSGQSSRSSSSSSPFPHQHPDVGEPAPRRDVAADAGIWDEGTGAGAADLADSSRVPTLPTLPLQASSNAVASHGNSLSARSAARPSGGAGGGASWTRTPPVPLTTRPGSVGSGVAASAMPLQESPYARSPRPPQAGATSDPPSPRARRRTRSTDEREAAPPAAAANGSLMGGVVGMERCSDSVDSAVRMHVADFNTAFANFVASGGKDPPPLAAARQALNATMVVDAAAVDQSHAAASRDFAATAPMRGSGNTGNGGGGGGGGGGNVVTSTMVAKRGRHSHTRRASSAARRRRQHASRPLQRQASSDSVAAGEGTASGSNRSSGKRKVVRVHLGRAYTMGEWFRMAMDDLGRAFRETRKPKSAHIFVFSNTRDAEEFLPSLKSGQVINRFPFMDRMAHKRALGTALVRMQRVFPDEYNFFPATCVRV